MPYAQPLSESQGSYLMPRITSDSKPQQRVQFSIRNSHWCKSTSERYYYILWAVFYGYKTSLRFDVISNWPPVLEPNRSPSYCALVRHNLLHGIRRLFLAHSMHYISNSCVCPVVLSPVRLSRFLPLCLTSCHCFWLICTVTLKTLLSCNKLTMFWCYYFSLVILICLVRVWFSHCVARSARIDKWQQHQHHQQQRQQKPHRT